MNMYNNENNDFISKRINNIYSIFNQGLISDLISIKYKNKIIAYKLFLNNYPQHLRVGFRLGMEQK